MQRFKVQRWGSLSSFSYSTRTKSGNENENERRDKMSVNVATNTLGKKPIWGIHSLTLIVPWFYIESRILIWHYCGIDVGSASRWQFHLNLYPCIVFAVMHHFRNGGKSKTRVVARCFSKAQERPAKTISSQAVSKNRKVYTPETSGMKGTSGNITALFNNTRTPKLKAQPTNAFSLPSIKCSEGPPSLRHCRTLIVAWTVHNDLITARSAAVESWEEPASIWLTVAKNAFVGWALNFSPRVIERRSKNMLTLNSSVIRYLGEGMLH